MYSSKNPQIGVCNQPFSYNLFYSTTKLGTEWEF